MSEQHNLAAAKRGATRTANMEQQVRVAMDAIEADMKANGGIYPHRGGAVSMAEIVRRSGINEGSIYQKRPKNIALHERATIWLESLKNKETVGRKPVEKTLAERAEEWRQKHNALEQRHICTELELQASKAEWEVERKELNEKIATLQRENAALTKLLESNSDRKVTALPAKEK